MKDKTLSTCHNYDANLGAAFKTLTRIREEKKVALPFLKCSLDYALLLYIGNERACGRMPNMNNILTSGLGTASTLIRRVTELEELGVIKKSRGTNDRRNTYYDLTDLPLARIQLFLSNIAALFAASELRCDIDTGQFITSAEPKNLPLGSADDCTVLSALG